MIGVYTYPGPVGLSLHPLSTKGERRVGKNPPFRRVEALLKKKDTHLKVNTYIREYINAPKF